MSKGHLVVSPPQKQALPRAHSLRLQSHHQREEANSEGRIAPTSPTLAILRIGSSPGSTDPEVSSVGITPPRTLISEVGSWDSGCPHYTGRASCLTLSPSSGLEPPPNAAITLSNSSVSGSYSIVRRLFCKTQVSEPWKHNVEGFVTKLILTLLEI